MKSPAAVQYLPILTIFAISLGLITLPIFTLTAAAAESDLNLEQILDRMEAQYTNNSFKAEFAQESTLKAMDISDFASGKIFVRYPGMMRWEYDELNLKRMYSSLM